MKEYRLWYTCCACGISFEEGEGEQVVDFEGKFAMMCHRCFHDIIGEHIAEDDEEDEEE